MATYRSSSGRSGRSSSVRSRSTAASSRRRTSTSPRPVSTRKPASSARARAQRERQALERKAQRSNKAAGKGAIVILAIALVAIKAFSSLPTTVKTSEVKVLHHNSSSTTTSSPGSFSSSSSSSSVAGSSAPPDQVVLPGASASRQGASAPVSSTTQAPVPKSSSPQPSGNSLVTVRVFNGTTISGAAGRVTNELARDNYNVVAPANATTQNVTTTVIYYSPGYVSQADRLAVVLGLSTTSVKPYSYSAPLPSVQPSDLNVVLGTDKA